MGVNDGLLQGAYRERASQRQFIIDAPFDRCRIEE